MVFDWDIDVSHLKVMEGVGTFSVETTVSSTDIFTL